jgi:predicted nucleic acid-binding protein
MIVVDTNVLAWLHLRADLGDRVDAWFREDPDWAAPYLWRSEFRNVLAGYVKRRDLDLPAAIRLFDSAADLVQGREHAPDSGLVLQLANQSGHSAYDCEFVALAMELNAPLLTADRRLAERFPEHAVLLAGK